MATTSSLDDPNTTPLTPHIPRTTLASQWGVFMQQHNLSLPTLAPNASRWGFFLNYFTYNLSQKYHSTTTGDDDEGEIDISLNLPLAISEKIVLTSL